MQKSATVLARSRKVKFFEGLGSRELREIIDAAEVRNVGARNVVLMAGETATQLFLLISGYAQFYRLSREGEKVLLTRLVNGDVFGLGSLLSRRVHYIGTAETTRDSEFLVWDHLRIRKLAQKYPKLAENALAIILQYLSAHTDRLVDLLTLNAAERLARAVYHLGERAGKIVPTGVEIEVTNEELSELAHVSSFTVSRLLNKWARAGALAKSRGKVFIKSPETLLET
jgi:CRP/FNR family transcriptional regulator, nitrogen oxide reductase regulator